MAANIAKAGFDLSVYNRTRAIADDFVAVNGGTLAETPEGLFAAADFVVTMLADGDVFLEVYEQATQGIHHGLIGIDMGTSGPDAVSEVRQRMEARGAVLVDAPVSGSTSAAEAATLLIMVGATAGSYASVQPVLAAMGKPELVGPPGAAAVLKLTVNSILYAVNQAFAEGLALAEAAGVAPATTQDVVSRSAAGAPIIAYRKQQYLDPDNSPVTFTLDLAAKDLRLALTDADARGVRMPQLQRTLETVEQLIKNGHGGRDLGFVVQAARNPEVPQESAF